MNKKVNLEEKLNLFTELWSPKIVGELNGQYVKLAKMQGEFMWHSHEHEDELIYVISPLGGRVQNRWELRDKNIEIKQGEFYIVPKGVEHKPVAYEEAHVLLLEPKSTEQTGGIDDDLLVDNQPWI